MNHFLRLSTGLGFVASAALGASLALTPQGLMAQPQSMTHLLAKVRPMLAHSGSNGYLGVDVADVDAEKAQALKLKDLHGALITLIDHDAPAGKAGLRVNDVVLQLNGKAVENADQLRKMLRGLPAGQKVDLAILRDGGPVNLTVELANRKAMEKEVWKRIGDGGDVFSQPPSMSMLSGGEGNAPLSGGFHLPFFGSSLNVGALVEPLTSQMADYLGVQSGVMVKQVARKSEAEAAGFRAFDVILKIGPESIATSADWDRALRSNRGRPVAVTILRNKKQEVLILQVDSKHHTALETPGGLPQCGKVMAELRAPGLDSRI